MAVEYLLATDEQRELAELAGQICEKELGPQVDDLEKANDGRGKYPMDVHKKLAEAGFSAMNLSEEWGGLGLSFVTRGLIYEEMSKTDLGFAFSQRGATEKADFIVDSHLPDDEKKKWIDGILAGDIIGAFAHTEPEAGSDANNIKTTAVKDGDEWVINGSKCFITNAPIANFFKVVAVTDKSKGPKGGISAFFVERDRPGVSTGLPEMKMGLKLSPTSTVSFDDVRVPEDHLIGRLGWAMKGEKSNAAMWAGSRPYLIAFAVGAAQKAVDVCKAYAKERVTFKHRIVDHQALGFEIADMQMKVDMVRNMVYTDLEAVDRGIDIGRYSPGCKAVGAEICQQVAWDAIQILGGYGYMHDYGLEKIARDCRIFSIFDGSSEIMREIVRRQFSKS